MLPAALAAATCRVALDVGAVLSSGPPLSVLIFHRVLDRHDPLQPQEPTVDDFASRMAWIRSCFNVIPLADAVAGLRSGKLPRRALSITFDDGYADNLLLAAPVLAKLGLPATFFIATGFLDGGRMFNDVVIETVRRVSSLDLQELNLGRHATATVDEKRRAISDILARLKYLPPGEREKATGRISEHASGDLGPHLMMTSGQVRELHRMGFELGGHTVSHPILRSTDATAARTEIVEGRRQLEQIIGARVRLFAYPNGRPDHDYGLEHVDMVGDAGFDAAVSTAWGVARPDTNLYQIPRFTPWDRPHHRFGLRMARNLFESVRYATA